MACQKYTASFESPRTFRKCIKYKNNYVFPYENKVSSIFKYSTTILMYGTVFMYIYKPHFFLLRIQTKSIGAAYIQDSKNITKFLVKLGLSVLIYQGPWKEFDRKGG